MRSTVINNRFFNVRLSESVLIPALSARFGAAQANFKVGVAQRAMRTAQYSRLPSSGPHAQSLSTSLGTELPVSPYFT